MNIKTPLTSASLYCIRLQCLLFIFPHLARSSCFICHNLVSSITYLITIPVYILPLALVTNHITTPALHNSLFRPPLTSAVTGGLAPLPLVQLPRHPALITGQDPPLVTCKIFDIRLIFRDTITGLTARSMSGRSSSSSENFRSSSRR